MRLSIWIECQRLLETCYRHVELVRGERNRRLRHQPPESSAAITVFDIRLPGRERPSFASSVSASVELLFVQANESQPDGRLGVVGDRLSTYSNRAAASPKSLRRSITWATPRVG